MDLSVPEAALSELAPAYFQAVVTVALAVLCATLHRRYRKPYLLAWAVAWVIYALRMGAIISFMHTEDLAWLYWHQVFTGWTAVALLWAALVFWRQTPWRPSYLLLVLFPPVWSFLAIYRLDNFLLAAGPAVLFLSGATLATGWAFFRYRRETASVAAGLAATAMLLWALHHLDYPFLRARGVWNPWGYYLDMLFELGLGLGILLLVQEDLDEGLTALSALSAELQPSTPRDDLPAALLERALTLRAVRGSALFLGPRPGSAPAAAGAGDCREWTSRAPPQGVTRVLELLIETGEPQVAGSRASRSTDDLGGHAYLAALPVLQGEVLSGALVVVGEARDPFTALDTPFLVALGQQVGAALEHAELTSRLADRTTELERLQVQFLRRQEEERHRISRELHDETAQVLAAVNLQLGDLQDQSAPEMSRSLDQARRLVREGIRTIRSVTRNLRPVALDDLGLRPALRAISRTFSGGGKDRLDVSFTAPAQLPDVGAEGELALYRSLQEAFANSVRHGRATAVMVEVAALDGGIRLRVDDDGRGFPEGLEADGGRLQSGLAGMGERATSLGGGLALGVSEAGGARVDIWIPVVEGIE